MSFVFRSGCGDLRRVWPAPAGRLALPPAGHAHRPLLQVQMQQRRRRPAADLNAPQRHVASSSRQVSPLFHSVFLPPALRELHFSELGLKQPPLCMRRTEKTTFLRWDVGKTLDGLGMQRTSALLFFFFGVVIILGGCEHFLVCWTDAFAAHRRISTFLLCKH